MYVKFGWLAGTSANAAFLLSADETDASDKNGASSGSKADAASHCSGVVSDVSRTRDGIRDENIVVSVTF